MTLKASPINMGLPQYPMAVSDTSVQQELDKIYDALHNLHLGITGTPSAAPAVASDLATAITAINTIRTRLIELGIMA